MGDIESQWMSVLYDESNFRLLGTKVGHTIAQANEHSLSRLGTLGEAVAFRARGSPSLFFPTSSCL